MPPLLPHLLFSCYSQGSGEALEFSCYSQGFGIFMAFPNFPHLMLWHPVLMVFCCFPYSYTFWFFFCLHYDLIRIYQILPYSETSDCKSYLIKMLIVYLKSVCWEKQWTDSSKSLSMDCGQVCKPETTVRWHWGRYVLLYNLVCTQSL